MHPPQKESKPVEPPIPRFSTDLMDGTVDPHEDFFSYSAGRWIQTNPLPEDKARWTTFDELYERNLYLLWLILEDSAADVSAEAMSPSRLVGDFYKSGMNLGRIEELSLEPIRETLRRVKEVQKGEELARCLAELRNAGIRACFTSYSMADKKNSSIYAMYLEQGGLSLPDREYYLADSFKELREAYSKHLARMFVLLGEREEEGGKLAGWVLNLETEFAKTSRTRAELRDEERNYSRLSTSDLKSKFPSLHLFTFLEAIEVPPVEYVVLGQPEFFFSLDRLFSEEPVEEIRAYLCWCILHAYAPYLSSRIEEEDFDFFRRRLMGQKEPEPRWKRVVRAVDELLGEALGSIYVQRYFPPEAGRRVALLIEDIRQVFRERLSRLPWMAGATRQQALDKFDKFAVKIGHPESFRDYSSVLIDPSDYAGNVQRASAFETRRQASRVGKQVDRTEWLMTPPTVDAYFSPTENEIVFPAGILQPPYFDLSLDDAVNYASIGAVIGHEITHGYDDQGRKFDGEGNLRDWWTPDDEREFNARAREVKELYDSQQALPGVHVNGELTLGENIADFGGLSIAFEAFQRRLTQEPEKRQNVDGLSPEQRFFIAWGQIWRENISEEELRRELTINPHSPNRYRAMLPAINHPSFDQAFPQTMGGDVARARRLVAVW